MARCILHLEQQNVFRIHCHNRRMAHVHRPEYQLVQVSLHSHPIFKNICNATQLIDLLARLASMCVCIILRTLKCRTAVLALIWNVNQTVWNHCGNLQVFLFSSQYIPFSRMLRNVCSSEAHFSIQYSRSSALSYAMSSSRIHSEKFFMFLLILSVLAHSLLVLFPMNLSTRTYIYQFFVARPITYG